MSASGAAMMEAMSETSEDNPSTIDAGTSDFGGI